MTGGGSVAGKVLRVKGAVHAAVSLLHRHREGEGKVGPELGQKSSCEELGEWKGLWARAGVGVSGGTGT